jgi:hypothetical protein
MKSLYKLVTVPAALTLFIALTPPLLFAGAFLSEEKQTKLGLAFRDLIKGTVGFFD